MSETATVTAKNQITIPKGLREELGVKPGDRLVFLRTSEGKFLVDVVKIPSEPAKFLEGTLEDLEVDAVTLKHSIHHMVAKRTGEKLRVK